MLNKFVFNNVYITDNNTSDEGLSPKRFHLVDENDAEEEEVVITSHNIPICHPDDNADVKLHHRTATQITIHGRVVRVRDAGGGLVQDYTVAGDLTYVYNGGLIFFNVVPSNESGEDSLEVSLTQRAYATLLPQLNFSGFERDF